MGFCYDLKYEVEDLEDAWDFAKKDQLESEDEDDEMNQGQRRPKS